MVPITLVNVLILCAAAALVVVVQPSLLGASASMCGEEKKSWGVRLAAIVIAGLSASLGQLVYGFTLGLVLAKLGTFPVALGAIAVGFAITSVVYSAFLRISVGRAAGVAAVYWAASAVSVSLVGLAIKLFLG